MAFLLDVSGCSIHWRKAGWDTFEGKFRSRWNASLRDGSKEESLLQTDQLWACVSFLIWWRWRERTSTWPSLLSIFNSFVFWDHLLQRLNCANPQSKLCSLHFCESGQNAESQLNVHIFSPIPFLYSQKSYQILHMHWFGRVYGQGCTPKIQQRWWVPLALLSHWFNFSVICCTQEHQSCCLV